MSAKFRAIVILKAKPNFEKKLLDFTLEVAPRIRQVDGLERLEVNRAVDDAGRLVLYYWWNSPAHSDLYVAGPLYGEIMPKLKTMLDEHLLVMTENIDS
jgi:quinol monooxygenase YgiN